MSAQENAAGLGAGEAAYKITNCNPNNTEEKPKQQGKSATILSILKSGVSLNRFDAEPLGDHCLHSTISELRSKGFIIHDEWESVPTRFNKRVQVKRYVYAGCAGNGQV